MDNDYAKNYFLFCDELLKMGALRHTIFEKSQMYDSDFHSGNMVIDKSGKMILLDLDGFRKFDYPKEWKKVILELNTALSSIEIIPSSYYRFGFLQNGGIVAKELFNILRRERGLSSFKCSDKFVFELNQDKIKVTSNEEVISKQFRWIEIRESIPFGDINNTDTDFKILTKWRSIEETLKLSEEEKEWAFEYNCCKQLYVSMGKNIMTFIEAMLNLAEIAKKRNEYLKACGIFLYVLKLITKDSQNQNAPITHFIEDHLTSAIKNLDTQGLDNLEYLLNDIDDTFLFIYLWHLDDLEEGTLIMKKDIHEEIEID